MYIVDIHLQHYEDALLAFMQYSTSVEQNLRIQIKAEPLMALELYIFRFYYNRPFYKLQLSLFFLPPWYSLIPEK